MDCYNYKLCYYQLSKFCVVSTYIWISTYLLLWNDYIILTIFLPPRSSSRCSIKLSILCIESLMIISLMKIKYRPWTSKLTLLVHTPLDLCINTHHIYVFIYIIWSSEYFYTSVKPYWKVFNKSVDTSKALVSWCGKNF